MLDDLPGNSTREGAAAREILSAARNRKRVHFLIRSFPSVSHSKLIAQVWGPEYTDCRHYLRLYVRYLRAKLEDSPQSPELIQNEWGVGYRFEPKPV